MLFFDFGLEEKVQFASSCYFCRDNGNFSGDEDDGPGDMERDNESLLYNLEWLL